MIILETPRLYICELTHDDAPFIYELLNSPGWLEFIGNRGIKNIDDAINYIENGPVKSYAENNFGLYAVKLKQENVTIGINGLIKRASLQDIDIGFAFLPEYEGKGFAMESSKAILDDAKTNKNLKRIVAITEQGNSKSICLLTKSGFVFEKLIQLEKETKELMLFAIEF